MSRLEQVRGRRYLVVGLLAAVSVLLIYTVLTLWSVEWWRDRSYGQKAEGVHWRLSVSFALVALGLLATALIIGPIHRIRGGSLRVVHLPWRRAVGVMAGVFAWTHVVFGITVHSPGWRIWLQFGQVTESNRLRLIFGVAVWLGLFVALAFVPLVVTSNSGLLRRLGPHRWKRVQRLSYAAFVVLGLHVVAVQYTERRDVLHIALVALAFLVVLGMQFAGLIATRRSRSASSTITATEDSSKTFP